MDQKNPFDGVLPKVMTTVRAAAGLAKQDVKFYSSLDRDIDQSVTSSAANLLSLATKLVALCGDSLAQKLSNNDDLSSSAVWSAFTANLDSQFEKAEFLMDHFSKGGTLASGSQFTMLDDGTRGEKFAAVKIKPQENFKTPVDNSDSLPFKPKLQEKPHAMIPLAESLQIPEDSDSLSLPHPYQKEIMESKYPDLILTESEPLPSTDWSTTKCTWVNTPELLAEMIKTLENASEIAVDLEHHDYRTYYGITCLMQISDRQSDWIVDTLALREELVTLNVIFANPNIIKVFHGANMDIIWLQRDLGLYIVSLFDTFHASKALGFPKFSLAYLLESYAQFKTSKKYQLADWRIRPIPSVMMDYARSDTHFLLNIFDKLRNMLVKAGKDKLSHVLHESRKVALRRFEYIKFRTSSPDQHLTFSEALLEKSFLTNYNVPLAKYPLVRALFEWRDSVARIEDESVRYVMSNQILARLCDFVTIPTKETILQVIKGSPLLVSNLETIHEIVCQNHAVAAPIAPIEPTKEIPEQTAEEISNLFEQISQSHSHSSDTANLIITCSKALPKGDSNTVFSVSVPIDGLAPFAVSLAAIQGRLEIVDECNAYEALVPALVESVGVDEDFEDSNATENKEIQPIEDNEVGVQKSEISAIKKIHNSKQKKRKAPESQDVFDYTTTESVFEKEEPLQKKKRSFDPYKATVQTGPKPARSRRALPSGKSTTFTK